MKKKRKMKNEIWKRKKTRIWYQQDPAFFKWTRNGWIEVSSILTQRDSDNCWRCGIFPSKGSRTSFVKVSHHERESVTIPGRSARPEEIASGSRLLWLKKRLRRVWELWLQRSCQASKSTAPELPRKSSVLKFSAFAEIACIASGVNLMIRRERKGNQRRKEKMKRFFSSFFFFEPVAVSNCDCS